MASNAEPIDPDKSTIQQLMSWLTAHNVDLPPAKQKKPFYVDKVKEALAAQAAGPAEDDFDAKPIQELMSWLTARNVDLPTVKKPKAFYIAECRKYQASQAKPAPEKGKRGKSSGAADSSGSEMDTKADKPRRGKSSAAAAQPAAVEMDTSSDKAKPRRSSSRSKLAAAEEEPVAVPVRAPSAGKGKRKKPEDDTVETKEEKQEPSPPKRRKSSLNANLDESKRRQSFVDPALLGVGLAGNNSFQSHPEPQPVARPKTPQEVVEEEGPKFVESSPPPARQRTEFTAESPPEAAPEPVKQLHFTPAAAFHLGLSPLPRRPSMESRPFSPPLPERRFSPGLPPPVPLEPSPWQDNDPRSQPRPLPRRRGPYTPEPTPLTPSRVPSTPVPGTPSQPVKQSMRDIARGLGIWAVRLAVSVLVVVILMSLWELRVLLQPRPPFCNPSQISTAEPCTPCPQNGICSEGVLTCVKGYEQQGVECVQSATVQKLAYKMQQAATRLLQERLGEQQCGYLAANESKSLKSDELKEQLMTLIPRDAEKGEEWDLAATEMMVKLKGSDAVTNTITKAAKNGTSAAVYEFTAKTASKPLSCRAWEFAIDNWLQILGFSGALFIIMYVYIRIVTYREQSRLHDELVRVIIARLQQMAPEPQAIDLLKDELWRDRKTHRPRDPVVWEKVKQTLKTDKRISSTNARIGQVPRNCWYWVAPL